VSHSNQRTHESLCATKIYYDYDNELLKSKIIICYLVTIIIYNIMQAYTMVTNLGRCVMCGGHWS